jgi:small subunit ribosomal protein S4
MARYTGSVCHLCRRCGDKLMLKGSRCYTQKCAMERRRRPVRTRFRRRRVSDRGLQLAEKQKARYTYGVLEKQFRRAFAQAERQSGVTGDNLIALLERRLDNVVYRLGFADSRNQARQIVLHGHIVLSGHRTNIPSCLVKEGDTISWREGSAKTEYYKQVVDEIKSKAVPSWLGLDRDNLVGQVISTPTPEDAGVKFEGQSIVEYYSR